MSFLRIFFAKIEDGSPYLALREILLLVVN